MLNWSRLEIFKAEVSICLVQKSCFGSFYLIVMILFFVRKIGTDVISHLVALVLLTS